MFKRSARLTAAGLAVGSAFTLFGGAGASQAALNTSQPAPSTVRSSPILQPNSNIRTGPGTSYRILNTSGPEGAPEW